jgi:mannose/fructose/N-acetylgalactosamine-specific phosphotransferase system component IID
MDDSWNDDTEPDDGNTLTEVITAMILGLIVVAAFYAIWTSIHAQALG